MAALKAHDSSSSGPPGPPGIDIHNLDAAPDEAAGRAARRAASREAAARATGVETEAERLGERLPALLVHAERVAMTVAHGLHGRRRPGHGETFWQYRAFNDADSYRAVDWRRSARSDELFVRETEWEAAQTVWLWRDPSPSMDFASSKDLPTKRARADLISTALAALLLRGGERVGLFGGGGKPGLGRAALRRIASDLLLETRTGDSLPAESAPPLRSHMVLIGDMLERPAALQRRVAAYAQRGVRGVICQTLDPAEESLPYRGRVRFSGMEGEGETLLDRVDGLRGAYHGALRTHRDALREICRRTGWTYLLHHTDKPAEHALLLLYEILEGGDRPLSAASTGGRGAVGRRMGSR